MIPQRTLFITLFLFFFTLLSFGQCGKGTIVISEVYFDTHYNEKYGYNNYAHFGEYIELFNSSNIPVDISGWVIKDNHTKFTLPAGTIINPGNFKIITFGNNYEGSIGPVAKFVELFPEAAGRQSDIIVQSSMVLYNDADKISLFNTYGNLIDQVVYINKNVNQDQKSSALNYMGVDSFDIDFYQQGLGVLYNKTGGAFNGAIPTGRKKAFYLSNPDHYLDNGDDREYKVAVATPFTIPYAIDLEDPSTVLFAAFGAMHYIHSTTFDIKNESLKTSESMVYYDDLAKPQTSFSYDPRTSVIWAGQTTYDNFGRVDKQSFPAMTCSFDNVGVLSDDYYNNALLKWYYSDNNTKEPYQATATHPYSQFNYDNLNPGNVINAVGGNMINGEWKTGYVFTVPAAQEMYYLYGKDYFNGGVDGNGREEVITKFYKTVSIDANGTENVLFTDAEGKALASARSGDVRYESPGVHYPVISLIGMQGYVDVHIPQGVTSSEISFIGNPSAYTVYDLKTGLSTSGLAGGNCYRIIAHSTTPLTETPKTYINQNGTITYDTTQDVRGIMYKVNYYDYSVNIYNATGQPIKSIQPNGTAAAYSASFSNGVTGTPAYMGSSGFASTYKYNTLGQVVEATSTDEGAIKLVYRNDGQVRYSQNQAQLVIQAPYSYPRISYTDYDNYGRPISTGVVESNQAIAQLSGDGALLSGKKWEQIFVIYDYTDNLQGQPAPPSLSTLLINAGISPATYVQKNLSGAVAVNYTRPADTGAVTAASWYSYDIYGQLEWMAQYNEGLPIKTIHYNYDYKGNVLKVIYQKDVAAEKFVHRYTYGNGDELVKVETSVNDSNFTLHTDYEYYTTGELKRKKYAGGIQGVDFVYALNGMLKSINHPSLEQAKDPGHDSNDLFGLILDYYDGDYERSNTKIDPLPPVSATNLYTGNIRAMRFANKSFDFVNNTINQKVYLYNYNNNGWLTGGSFGSINNNSIVQTPSKYKESDLKYDPNGNIKSLLRSDENANIQDYLSYYYYGGKNQLEHVSDVIGDGAKVGDIDNQGANNYIYNAIGQLTDDVKEGLKYTYNSEGLVTRVGLTNGISVVDFAYNERGQRIRKRSYNTSNGALMNTTYYVVDASGNTVGIYNHMSNGTLTLVENAVYGNDMLGVYTRADQRTNYQLTDHLGNVRAVFTNNSGTAGVKDNADYYPFGEKLAGRNIFSGYRYAFQGQELDPETGKEAFKLRLWDGRLGRWLSPDPMGQYSSPYMGMGNNPIGLIDPDGGSTEGSDNKYKGVWNKETNKYDYTYIDNTGGDFYDIVNYEGGQKDGITGIFINPMIKVQENWFSEDQEFLEATSKRVGVGEWKYHSEAITPGHFEELLPIPAAGKYLGKFKPAAKILTYASKVNFAAKKKIADFMVKKMLGGKFSHTIIKNEIVTVNGAIKHIRYDLKGPAHGTLLTPHKQIYRIHLNPQNGKGRAIVEHEAMSWSDMIKVWWDKL